jgi:purine-binding chemotaxis protein CheW
MSTATRGLAHLVVFRVDNDRFAIRSDHVERVLERTTIETLPWLPRTVAGVLRHDGEWLPIVDPVAALNSSRPAVRRPTVLVLRRAGLHYGLTVDEAMGRRELRAHRLQEGGAARTVTRFEDLEGALVLSDDEGLITLLDPARLFKAEAVEEVEQRRRDWSDAGSASIVSFRAGGANLGLHVAQVSEVMPWQEPDALESGHAYMIGSLTVRDQRVPLLDLARLFGLQPAPRDHDSRILIVEVGGERYGLVVDHVRDVERVPADAITAAPRLLRRIAGDAVDAVARVDDDLLLLIRLDLLMSLATVPAAPSAAPKRRGRRQS